MIFGVLIARRGATVLTCRCASAAKLRSEAAGQLKVTDVAKALRGSIVDRNGSQLAFTIEARR